MQDIRNKKILVCLLVSISIVLMFSGCSDSKGPKKYNELLKSYETDKNYKSRTDAIKKSVSSNNTKSPIEAFNNTVHLTIANSGKFKGIPILVYHCVDSSIWGDRPMFVSPDNFDKQMQYLKDEGYESVNFSDLEQIDTIKKPVLITFDDGYEDNYTNAYPILKKYGFKATIFLVADFIGKQNFLKFEQIRKMQDNIDFQSHTMTHKQLTRLDPVKVEYELSESKAFLEKNLGKKVFVLAYPYGNYDKSVINLSKKYYDFGVTTNYGKFIDTPINDFTVKRMYVVNQMKLDKFIRLFR